MEPIAQIKPGYKVIIKLSYIARWGQVWDIVRESKSEVLPL